MKRAGLTQLAAASLLAAVLLAAPAAAQCVMCKTALTNSPEGRAAADSFNRAILLMLAAPYAVFGTLAAVAFRRPLVALVRRRLPGAPHQV